MFSLKSIRKPWSGDWQKSPQRNENCMVVDSLMLELEFHVHEFEKLAIQNEQEEHRRKTGVDYSWLISRPRKRYEIPQLERLELEELCYQVKPSECSKVISLFRDSMLNEPLVHNLPRNLKACVNHVLDQRKKRQKEKSLAEWVTKKTYGLVNAKLRPHTRVMPSTFESDSESQTTRVDSTESSFHFNAYSSPYFSRRGNTGLPVQ